MLKELRSAAAMFLVLTVLTGMCYPLLVTAIAQLVFPYPAGGSLIVRDGNTLGSELIGQAFDKPGYFWGRPSATVAFPNDASSSSGSNYGPTNPTQLKAVADRLQTIKEMHSDRAPVPVELVTASASGLDPHISPAAAEYQVARIAEARGLSEETVRRLVDAQTEHRTLAVLGEPRVNVLKLNLSLDEFQR
jgi:K+-transporting ATPase ATPase C chain